jgi:hypothetical protein
MLGTAACPITMAMHSGIATLSKVVTLSVASGIRGELKVKRESEKLKVES